MTPTLVSLLAGLGALGTVVLYATRKPRTEDATPTPAKRWFDNPSYASLGTVSEDWIKNALRR